MLNLFMKNEPLNRYFFKHNLYRAIFLVGKSIVQKLFNLKVNFSQLNTEETQILIFPSIH